MFAYKQKGPGHLAKQKRRQLIYLLSYFFGFPTKCRKYTHTPKKYILTSKQTNLSIDYYIVSIRHYLPFNIFTATMLVVSLAIMPLALAFITLIEYSDIFYDTSITVL